MAIMIYRINSAGEESYAIMLVVLLILLFNSIMITIKCGSSSQDSNSVESNVFKSGLPYRKFEA